MSLEEDLLMTKVAKLDERVKALEAIVTHPHGAASGQETPPAPEPEAASEYEAFTVEELRNELRGRGLATSGNKAELVERLVAADVTTGDGDGAG